MNHFSVFAPGRAELLGNHTDYNQGFVLAIAVESGTTLSGGVISGDLIELTSKELHASQSTPFNKIAREDVAPWSRYVLGVVDQFQKHNLPVGAFQAQISSNLPIGAGLSSSASLEIATALFLRKAFGGNPDPLTIAKLAQLCENTFVGVNCGILDQISSLLSKANHTTFIDCRSLEVKNEPLSDGVSFVIANSGVKHSLVAGEYNERRHSCEAAAEALGVPALRDITMERLLANEANLDPLAYKRALHIVGENERVLAGVTFLEAGDLPAFGQLMFASHQSSIANFENSCPELDALVEAAKTVPEVLGARLSGGGFGGATINLVRKGFEKKLVDTLTAVSSQVSCLVTAPADGAWILNQYMVSQIL